MVGKVGRPLKRDNKSQSVNSKGNILYSILIIVYTYTFNYCNILIIQVPSNQNEKKQVEVSIFLLNMKTTPSSSP